MTDRCSTYLQTPAQARQAGVSYYDPKTPCQAGHVAVRRLSDGACTLCLRAADRDADKARG